MPEDPKMKLTKWLTDLEEKSVERSRMLAPEQKRFYHGELFLARLVPDLTFVHDIVTEDIRQMVAYKGKRSEEITTCLSSAEIEEIKQRGLTAYELKERAKQIKE